MTEPAGVQPTPTPFAFSCGIARDATGTALVAVKIDTVTGTVFLFCSPDEAIKFSDQWRNVALSASGGLTIAQVLPPSNGRVHPRT